jgi:hypothetical protein
MVDGDFGKLETAELFAEQRGEIVGSPKFNELNAEIVRRVASIQIKASESQVQGAKVQTLAVIAMFLAVLATLIAPWIAPH